MLNCRDPVLSQHLPFRGKITCIMIPLSLSISGFLSYRDPVELDFSTFELACISGANGAGKSSLLDAITWALFGIARKRDDTLINTQSDAAEVVLIFAYEGNCYRVQRSLPRGKTSALEFQILQDRELRSEGRDWSTNLQTRLSDLGAWKALTERTLRETQRRIEGTLRMDYETFTNASFFLQGKADLFTQQRPTDRKRILASILGLEIWETYRQRAAERRKSLEAEVAALEGRLAEINTELDEEKKRKEQLKTLKVELDRLAKSRKTQEKSVESLRLLAAGLAERRKGVEAQGRTLLASAQQLEALDGRLAARSQERQLHRQTLERASEIEAAYKDWQKARNDVEYWDEIAARFREHEKRRQAPLDEINAVRAALAQEKQTLDNQQTAINNQQATINSLELEIADSGKALERANDQLAQREALAVELESARQSQSDARAENPLLREKMDELKQRIDQLDRVEGAECPTCGQPLGVSERLALVGRLTDQGKEMGDRFRANVALVKETDQHVSRLDEQIAAFARIEAEQRTHGENLARLTARLEAAQAAVKDWETSGAPRLVEIALILQQENFSPEARKRLSEIDGELKNIGYDAAAHDIARGKVSEGRAAEDFMRGLERAQATLAPLEREIADLEKQASALRDQVKSQQSEYDQAVASLAAAEAQAPDMEAAEGELLDAQEQENRLRMDVGAAQQKVDVLGDLKARRKSVEAEREEKARLVGQYKQIERACSKDGVPALLIEQALPEIEGRANSILERLSAGGMSVRFVTQAAYKDRRREDLRETLDIQISDGAGTRDYEMFSGGEAFRVNFAIRLALSEVLAQRAGARLQTLVIDEGFGSQDALGRQRLIEAINLVRPDFAKVLVITHIDELKDAFPSRIEVEKSERGSTFRVVS